MLKNMCEEKPEDYCDTFLKNIITTSQRGMLEGFITCAYTKGFCSCCERKRRCSAASSLRNAAAKRCAAQPEDAKNAQRS